ncbi:MAG: phosphatidylglycerophosphatase A [bacterium]
MRTLAGRLAEAVGTGFYSGLFPIAPGTVGSVVGVVLYLALVRLGAVSAGFSLGWVVVLAAVLVVGALCAGRLERRLGPDHKRIVIDEVWGMLVSLAFLPPATRYVVAGFLLFRFFDIVKPFPARRAERITRGWGVMLDDGVAGIYACVVLHLARAVLG